MLRINDIRIYEDISNEEVIKELSKKPELKLAILSVVKSAEKVLMPEIRTTSFIITLLILKLIMKTITLN